MNSHVDPGVAFLTRLLALSEATPDRTRPASLAPDYDQLRTAEAISRFETQIRTAQRSGAVSIRNGKRERRHLIERVTVQDLRRWPVTLAESQPRSLLTKRD